MPRSASEQCVDALLAGSRALVGVAARSLVNVERDLTLSQFRTLVLLATRGPQRSGDLARELGVHASSVTGLCTRLEAKGLVERAPAPGNRREVIVAPTAKAAKLLKAVMVRRRREFERIVENLTPAQCKAVAQAIAVYASAAGEAPEDAWRLGWFT